MILQIKFVKNAVQLENGMQFKKYAVLLKTSSVILVSEPINGTLFLMNVVHQLIQLA